MHTERLQFLRRRVRVAAEFMELSGHIRECGCGGGAQLRAAVLGLHTVLGMERCRLCLCVCVRAYVLCMCYVCVYVCVYI